jgi:hypothetical protein
LEKADGDSPDSSGFWVGIRVEGHVMYSGTLIEDLMAAVERAEKSAELHGALGDVASGLFGLQAGQENQAEQFLAGAA